MIKALTDDDLDNIYLINSGVVLILFHSPSCAPCKISMNMFINMKTIDSINNTPITFRSILTDMNPQCIKFFNVKSLPFVVALNSESKSFVSQGGVLGYPEYEHLIEKATSLSQNFQEGTLSNARLN